MQTNTFSPEMSPKSLDEFVERMEVCVQSLYGLMSNAADCYEKLQCDDSEYITLRKKLFGEVAMYGQNIFPKTIVFVQNLKDHVEEFGFILDETEFASCLPTQVQEIGSYKCSAESLRSKHVFVLGNVDKLKRQAGSKEAASTVGAARVKDSAEGLATGAAVAATLGAASLGGAATGMAVTTSAMSVAALGMEASLVTIAAVPVVWPFALVGGVILGLSACLATKSSNKGQEAARLKATATSLNVLLRWINGFTQIVEVGATLLENLENELSGLQKHATRVQRAQYLRLVKTKIRTVLTLCDQYLSGRGIFQRTFVSIGEIVEEDFRAEWKRRLEAYELDHSQAFI